MPGEDKRHSIRISSRLEIQYRADETRAEGLVSDLSETGAWIDTLQPLPVGTDVTFRFFLPDDLPDVPVTGKATVVRIEPTVGMALHFQDLETVHSARLRFYVGALYFGQDPANLL